MVREDWAEVRKPADTSIVAFESRAKRSRSHEPERPVFLRSRLAVLAFLLITPSLSLFAQNPAAGARFVVVLDAAHGGDDAGANLGSEPEKSYTLALTVRLRSLLAARGMTVVATRDSDTTVDPGQRAQIADHANAQACLTLHASESGSGVHLFVSSLAPAQPAPFLPWKTAQAASIPQSLALAGTVNSALTHAGVAVTLGRIALPGIDSMTCPALAIEITPEHPSIQSADQSGKGSLDDSDYQTRVVNALAAALVEWRSSVRGGQP